MRRLTALAGALAILGAAGWYRFHATDRFFEPHALLARFPAEEGSVLSIDFRLLRGAGLLKASKVALEPEYKQFLEGTGFDYKRDLDSVLASFSPSGNFFIARGRFDWNRLRAYVARQNGSCYQQLCRVQGSTPERHISFLPLRDDALALAVSTNDLAATRLTNSGQPVTSALPSAPVWLSIPGGELRKPNTLPAGIRLMLSALQSADRIVVTIAPVITGIEARLETTCRTADDAKILASQLRTTTATLKQAFDRDQQAKGDQFAVLLTAGTFDQSDRKVTGKWPVTKNLLDALTQGI